MYVLLSARALSFVLSDNLSVPNYISVIFIANVFARRRVHFVAEEKRTVSYVGGPYRAVSLGGSRATSPPYFVPVGTLSSARLKFR